MPLSKYDIEADMVRAPGTSHALMVELVGSNKRVLDVGCDTGYLGVTLKALGSTVTGLEVDPVTAEEAAKHLDRVVVADLENVELSDLVGESGYDVVVFGDVLEHLRDPLPVLRSARRLLTPGGSVIISTPNVAHGDIRLALLQGRWDYTKVGILDDTHTRFFTRAGLVRFLTDAGFVLADLRRTRAPLFSTETGVREEDFDPALVESLRLDPEADTYQFVLRAVPDDVVNLEAANALRTDDLANRVHMAQAELVRLQGALDARTAELDDVRAERDALAQARDAQQHRADTTQSAHDVAVADRDRARAEIAQLRAGVPASPRAVVRRILGR